MNDRRSRVPTRRTIVAVALTFAAVGFGASVPAGAVAGTSTATADTATCTDVLFVGARGSGQPQSGASDDAGTGLGRQVYGMSQRLAAQLPGSTITTVAATYPAQGVELLAINPTAYFAVLEEGVANVQAELRNRAMSCPDERIVLAGYSQGAMVMHRALQGLAAAQDPAGRQLLARTDGAILVSDGDRRPRDRATDYGTARRSRGIGFALRPESGTRAAKLPAGMRSRIHSVCLALDVVCDYQPDVHNGIGALQGAAVHTDGYDDSRFVNRAVDAVADRIS